MASLAPDTTDPLGALELLVPRLLPDVAARGSTLLPGWSSIATTLIAATALTVDISPYSPPVLSLIPLTLPHFPGRRPLIPRFVPEARKAVSDDSDDFPSFKRSNRIRSSVRSGSVVSFYLSLV